MINATMALIAMSLILFEVNRAAGGVELLNRVPKERVSPLVCFNLGLGQYPPRSGFVYGSVLALAICRRGARGEA